MLVKAIKHTPLYVPAIIIFSLLFIPFVGSVPYLDGDTEFLIAVNFYLGKYLTHWMPYHPPLKLFLAAILFHFFGFFSYSFLGYLFGIAGIIALYYIGECLFDKKTAIVGTILFSLSGVYISSSLFSLNDFLLTVFLLLSFAFYVKEKYVWGAIMGSFAVMSKESAIMFPITIILVEAFRKKFTFIHILPFLTLLLWIFFLHYTGHTLWNSWNFSDARQSGSLFTIVDNLVSGKIFNKYAYENWLHLFIFNYNWFLWIFVIWAMARLVWNKYLSIISLFIILYSVTILSFQTYSIPRYILPILPFLYLFVAVAIEHAKYKYFFIPAVFACAMVSLFTSSDPISNAIWHKWPILNQSFYENKILDGNDGITYNMQFLYLTKARDQIIKTGKCTPYINTLSVYPETLKKLNIPLCQE